MRTMYAIGLMVILGLAAVPVITAPATQASTVYLHLYGDAGGGWSFAPNAETRPGPTITVNQGDLVVLQLSSDDGYPHTFLIDYNNNGVADAGEPLSPTFTDLTGIQFQFTANVAGTFTYFCTIHGKAAMSGTWITTATAADTTPPTISHIPPGAAYVGDGILITASVTDSGSGVASVRLIYTPIGGSELNVTMTGSGSDYTYVIPGQTSTGTVTYHFYAVDVAGNGNVSQQYSVTVQPGADTTPPIISNTPPGAVNIGDPIAITASVTDSGSGVASVKLVYTPVGGSEQNVSMTLSGNVYTYTIPPQLSSGNVTYHIYAVDATGNSDVSSEYSVAVQAGTASTPSDNSIYILAIAVVAVIVAIAAIAAVALRRRRKGAVPPSKM